MKSPRWLFLWNEDYRDCCAVLCFGVSIDFFCMLGIDIHVLGGMKKARMKAKYKSIRSNKLLNINKFPKYLLIPFKFSTLPMTLKPTVWIGTLLIGSTLSLPVCLSCLCRTQAEARLSVGVNPQNTESKEHKTWTQALILRLYCCMLLCSCSMLLHLFSALLCQWSDLCSTAFSVTESAQDSATAANLVHFFTEPLGNLCRPVGKEKCTGLAAAAESCALFILVAMCQPSSLVISAAVSVE